MLAKLQEALLKAVRATKARTYRPIGDRVLVRALTGEFTEKRGDLYVVSHDNEHSSGFYLVVATPADLEENVYAGDVVICGKYVGHEIVIDGDAYRLVPAQDVLARLPGADPEAM